MMGGGMMRGYGQWLTCASRHGPHPRLLVQLEQHTVVPMRSERRDCSGSIHDAEADHSFIIGDRTIEIRDLEPNAAEMGRARETIVRRRDAVLE